MLLIIDSVLKLHMLFIENYFKSKDIEILGAGRS